MNVTVTLSRNKETKNINLENKSTINDLLKIIQLKPDTVIVMEKNNPIPIDSIVKNGQKLTIIQVSSGG